MIRIMQVSAPLLKEPDGAAYYTLFLQVTVALLN